MERLEQVKRRERTARDARMNGADATLARLRDYRTQLGTANVLRLAGPALLAILLCVLLVARIAAAHDSARQSPASNRLVGLVAPDLTLTLWNASPGQAGQTLSMVALKGHPVVLNFWEASCDPCQAEAPLLARAWQTYQAQGVQFVGVALETSEQDGVAFLRQHGITYPNGPANTQEVAVRYALIGTPATFFVDRRGIIVGQSPGQLSQDTLNEGIGRALA